MADKRISDNQVQAYLDAQRSSGDPFATNKRINRGEARAYKQLYEHLDSPIQNRLPDDFAMSVMATIATTEESRVTFDLWQLLFLSIASVAGLSAAFFFKAFHFILPVFHQFRKWNALAAFEKQTILPDSLNFTLLPIGLCILFIFLAVDFYFNQKRSAFHFFH